jgi:hypothetical protein
MLSPYARGAREEGGGVYHLGQLCYCNVHAYNQCALVTPHASCTMPRRITYFDAADLGSGGAPDHHLTVNKRLASYPGLLITWFSQIQNYCGRRRLLTLDLLLQCPSRQVSRNSTICFGSILVWIVRSATLALKSDDDQQYFDTSVERATGRDGEPGEYCLS